MHFFNKYLSNAFCVLNMMFSTRDKVENETAKVRFAPSFQVQEE